jgi:tape measure domain-containing protein
MSESYSVEAILSARDAGFTAGMKAAQKSTESLGSILKKGIGFGAFAAAGGKAVSAVTNNLSGLVAGMNESSATWKTFTGNMTIAEKSTKQITKVRKNLQKFAEQTIYSSSDMASTYAQLAAVGTKNTTKLVKGFGGLASAAEDPQQAMKTLSQQATQMAAKPKVQWEDFKLMVEQTPAGVSAVAKTMGKSTQQMIKDVQDGKIATEDFFNAVAKTGTNKQFTKMATEYKTVGQAMDGLTETVSNKLQPAFDSVSSVGIKAVSAITDSLDKIDGKSVAKKIGSIGKNAGKYWEVLSSDTKEARSAVGSAVSAIGESLEKLNGSFGSTESVSNFKSVVDGVASGVSKFAGFCEKNSDSIAKLITVLPKVLIGYKAFKIVKTLAPGVSSFSKAILSLLGKGIGGLAAKLFGVAAGETAAGNSAKVSNKAMLTMAKSTMMLGVGVLTIAAGFGILAASSIALANSGGAAIGVMVGMVVAVVALAAGAAAIGPALTASSVGLIAFGAAVVLVGAGALLAAAAIKVISTTLPTLSEYGTSAAVSIAALGASMVAFGAGALVAGAGCVVLGAGLVVVGAGAVIAAAGVIALGAGATLLGAGLAISAASVTVLAGTLPALGAGAIASAAGFTALSASVLMLTPALLASSAGLVAIAAAAAVGAGGLTIFGGAMIVASGGTVILAGTLKLVNSSMKTIASNAKSAGKSLKGMQSSVKTTSAGLDAIGSKAKSAMSKLISAFSNASGKAKSSGQKVGTGFIQGMQPGLNKAPNVASSAVSKVNAKLRSGRSGAHAAGAYISQGFAQGMSSCLGQIEAAASRMVAAADKAIRAKAKIHSPSKMTEKDGKFMGSGFAKGIKKSTGKVKKVSEKLTKAALQKKKTNVYAKAIKSKVSYGIKAGLKSVKKKTKNLLGSSKTTLLKANQNRQYEDMASKAIDKYKTTINKKVSSTTKSLKKKVDAVTKSYQKKYKKNAKLKKAYTNAGKGLKEKITKKIKAQGNAAIKAVDKTLTALGKKYQKKYDAIASDRSNFLSKMSDYGDLFKSDDYGFISLVNFKSQTNQINALAKNMEHLKKVLPYNMMKDIQALDTAQGLKYTNELLKKGDTWLKQYGKDYTNFIATAKKNANTYYQPYITKLDTEYVNAVTKAIKDLQKKMNAIGTQASKGLVKGVSNKKNTKKVKKASNKLASTVPKTAKKKLKVHSPSRVMDKIAYYTGIGFVNRLEAMRKNVQSAMQGIVDVPAQMAPTFAGNFNGELSSDYEYYTKAEYTVNVPLEINGKEFARATAQDTMVEQNRLQRRNNRKNGKV